MSKTLLNSLLCGSFVIICTSLKAQKPTFGIFGGPQVSAAKYKIRSVKQETDFVTGAQAGVTLKIPFEANLYFSPAFYYSHKGYKVTFNAPASPPDSLAINNRTSIHTMELAPLLHFDFSNKPSHFFVRLGPAIDFALSGREEFDTREGKQVKRKMLFSITNHYGPFTAQGILHFGYESEKGLVVFAHYAEGMGSLNNTDRGPLIKHRIAGVSLGWYFNKHAE
jgi:hypothetical protein